VLSRCLQFNLRALQQAAITDQQIKILEAEEITFQPSAIDILSRAAAGSLRDALSLLDQAISHGGGQVEEERVRAMLGMIEDRVVFSLLNALADRDAEKLMSVVKEMAQKL
jgi:DNA polymerase-3 subunit gamma/tau